LLPKVDGTTKVSDYRPSLLNTSIKYTYKDTGQQIAASHHGPNSPKSRTIKDCLTWDFEYLHLYHKSRKELIILKLDFEKVFDIIEHQKMLQIIERKGFNPTCLHWMKSILNSSTSGVLLNGVPGKVFHHKRGVRHGDPLSPLLVVLATYFLQTQMNKAKELNLIKLQYLYNILQTFQSFNM
jgi:hypothetical protein